MERQREKRLPPTPSRDRGNHDLGFGELRVSRGGGNPGNGGNAETLGSPLGEGAYSHPRAAPLPPAQASDPVTSPSFPLSPLPGLDDYNQPKSQPQPQPRPQSRLPLRPAPWRTPTSPPRPPPGRLFERGLLSPSHQRPAQKASRSGSLPSINFSQRQTGGQQWQPHHSPRPVTPHPSHGVRSPPREFARSAIPPVPPTPVMVSPAAAAAGAAVGFQLYQRQPSSTFSPPIPEKSPRRSAVGNDSTRHKRRGTVSRELDVLEEQLVGLRVGEARRGKYNGEARRGEYPGTAKRRESTNSKYSQASEEQGSVYAETYHSFMFSDHPHGEPSQQEGHLNRPERREREGDHQNRREPPPQLFSPTTTKTRGIGAGSHYRCPNTPIAPPPIEPRARLEWLEGRRHGGEVEPTSPTPVRTITATRITRKPAKLRPVSTNQQAVRTPSPLSGTLKGPGPHVPDVSHGAHLETWTVSVGGGDDTGSGSDGGGGTGAPMFARELTASLEVMSSVAEPAAEEDERRGMVSRWSMDSSDLSDLSDSSDEEAMDVEVMDREVSLVSRSPTREAGQEAGQESAQKPSEEYHEAQEVAQEVAQEGPFAQDSTSSSSEPSPSSQRNEGTEPEKSEEPILPFDNLTTQLANLQVSLNHLVSQATSVEAAFGQVREAMIALRDRTREALVNTEQFMEEVERVERRLGEMRRRVKGKGKESEVGYSGEGEKQEQGMREKENGGQKEGNDNHKGHEKEQDRKREARREGQQHPEEPQEGPPKGQPKPRRGPPSGPAPGGAEWV